MTPYRLATLAVTVALLAIQVVAARWIAGTWELPTVWVALAAQGLVWLVGVLTLDENLLRERARPRGKDKDPWATAILSVLCVVIFVVAVLDVARWHWLAPSPVVCLVAVVVQLCGWLGLVWTMHTNYFFSSAIRLQPDRGQVVIDAGPYARIRHPGYALTSLGFLAMGPAMGSWLAVLPAVLVVADLVYRTYLEERMLREGLPGYADYAGRVKWRWLPGVW